MVRVLYIVGSCTLLAAGGVFGCWLIERSRGDLRLEEMRGGSSDVQMLKRPGGESGVRPAEVPPLVAQAQALSLYLNPPPSAERITPAGSRLATDVKPQPLPIRPLALSASFRVRGTSCCPNQSSRSMALISEAGAAEGTERWVKEGAEIGHFVIHEIRRDGIVYRDGDQLREMAVESFAGPTSIVQDVRRGSGRSVAAARDAVVPLPTPAEPNGAAAGEN